ncbi:nucleoside recognition domain-containing protein [Paenibacillus selenitireducens]|uniref:Nucleoside recognition domain-containing protein n=1 Tax=Paenibacillus selenitireducens TaxID=1324314 RepID=A0A1T2XDB3_9BACL|nr:nucleoside recognition domain-containing protein [Paenibacillus selenitireducens]
MNKNIRTSPWLTLISSFGAVLLVFCIVLYPDQAFQASLQGLSIWWKLIFPALLPFLVLSEMMIAFGFVHGLGILLDPVMKRLFGIPGVGGWALALGWTAGYPAGAEATAKLRNQQALERHEAHRLLALSHVSNPVFIVVVVGVGFLHQPQTGILLGIFHWGSALLTGIILHIISPRPPRTFLTDDTTVQTLSSPNSHAPKRRWQQIIGAIEEAHRSDGRTFGKLLGDAVTSAVQRLMMIGGYMMIFSIIAKIFHFLLPFTIESYWVQGFFEIHLGSYAFSHIQTLSTLVQMALLSGVLAWSGICAHLQVRSMTQSTDMSHIFFIATRFLHAILAMIITFACWNPLQSLMGRVMPTLLPAWTSAEEPTSHWLTQFQGWFSWYVLPIWFIGILALLMLGSGMFSLFRRRHS